MAKEVTPCAVCGTPTRSRYGACSKTPECKREYLRRYNIANRAALLEQKASWREANRENTRVRDTAYRAANQEAKKAQNAAYYAANREAILARNAAQRGAGGTRPRPRGKSQEAAAREREQRRQRMRRDDLPCRYAKFGCVNLKVRNSPYCRPHRKAAERRRLKRQQQAMKLRRAQAQGWACTWCGLSLPTDLGEAHQDHVIPRAVTMATIGRVINDEWNMDVLHAVCNIVKGDSLTPRAIALAAERGVDLGRMVTIG